MKKRIRLFIVQEEYGGIPEEPFITTNKKKADKKYMDWWAGQWREDSAEIYERKKPETLLDWASFAHDFDGDDFCRYWEKRITINV